MRANSGGSPGTVALFISYLLDAPDLPLFDILHRAPLPPDHYATEMTPPADRDAKRPVYVLTSANSFSAAEGLPFLLQERHRAEIVGEVTAGAANAGRPYRVNARFSVTIPNGRIRSAIGGGNWEGAGVTPDVRTTAADALKTAHARALRAADRSRDAGALESDPRATVETDRLTRAYVRTRLPRRTPVARGPLTRSSIRSKATLSPTASLLNVPNVVSLR